MSLKSKLFNISSKLKPVAMVGVPRKWRLKAEARLTEMAIESAKVEIAKRGIVASDLSNEQIELIVSDERDKILSKMKDRSLSVVFVLLGIQVI